MSYREDARIIKALADENRLAILELLQDGEKWMHYSLSEEGVKGLRTMINHYTKLNHNTNNNTCTSFHS